MTEGWLLQTSLCNWTNVVKKCVNNHCKEKTVKQAIMAELLPRNHKTMSKGSCKPRCTIEQWNKVLWTDKLKFEIFHSNRWVYVPWRVGERVTTPCIIHTIKHGGGSVMVWEAFANCKLGNLHQVMGKLNQTSYQSIWQHHVIWSGTWLVSQGFVLIQDNDPKHTSKLCQRYFKSKEEWHFLQLMSLLVQSADLYPIELVWDELDQKVRAKQAASTAHLW